jgi:hypothetical protein
LLAVLRAQKTADGMTSEARQLRQKMAAGTLENRWAGEATRTSLDEFL